MYTGLTYFLTTVQREEDATLIGAYLLQCPSGDAVLAPLQWERDKQTADMVGAQNRLVVRWPSATNVMSLHGNEAVVMWQSCDYHITVIVTLIGWLCSWCSLYNITYVYTNLKCMGIMQDNLCHPYCILSTTYTCIDKEMHIVAM